MDAFLSRNIMPMLIAEEVKPFDSNDFFYELKMDGMRMLAYLSADGSDFRNKLNHLKASNFPESIEIHKQVKGTVILDGEMVILSQGKPDFEKLLRRVTLTDPFKIKLDAKANPAIFVAFDILYHNGQELFFTPLNERKQLLSDVVHENSFIAISRSIVGEGIAFYNMAEGLGLEGIVAKRVGSYYYPGKRSKDWIKIKYMQEEDFVAAGYVYKEGSGLSIVLGRQVDDKLSFEGLVTLGVTWDKVKKLNTNQRCPFGRIPPGNEGALWFSYMPICTVKYMKRTSKGGMRQPVFKGFRIGGL